MSTKESVSDEDDFVFCGDKVGETSDRSPEDTMGISDGKLEGPEEKKNEYTPAYTTLEASGSEIVKEPKAAGLERKKTLPRRNDMSRVRPSKVRPRLPSRWRRVSKPHPINEGKSKNDAQFEEMVPATAPPVPPHAPSLRLCILQKTAPDQEYGYNLHAEKGRGQIIGVVDKDSVAEMAGLRPGDRIFAINGHSIVGEPHRQVIGRIKEQPTRCELLVGTEDDAKWYTDHSIPIHLGLPNIIRGTAMSLLVSQPEIDPEIEDNFPVEEQQATVDAGILFIGSANPAHYSGDGDESLKDSAVDLESQGTSSYATLSRRTSALTTVSRRTSDFPRRPRYEPASTSETLKTFQQLYLDLQEKTQIQMDKLQNSVWNDIYNLRKDVTENTTKTCDAINELRKDCTGLSSLNEKLYKVEPTEYTILIVGGMKNDYTEYAGAAVLSGSRSKWIELNLELPYEARGSGLVYLYDEIYLFGGFRNPKALYKLGKNLQWKRLADMNVGRKWITNSCLVWQGGIWVFGGKDEETGRLNSVEVYNVAEDRWTLMTNMTRPRSWAAAVSVDDRIIVTGGRDDEITNTVESFNLHDDNWLGLPDMPTGLSGHSLVYFNKKLIIMGGEDDIGIRKEVLETDSLLGSWELLPSMKNPSYTFAGIVLENEIYAIGGCIEEHVPQNRVEIFDGERWRDGPTLPYNWSGMSAVLIPKHLAGILCLYKPQ